jgi:uncharacterized protein
MLTAKPVVVRESALLITINRLYRSDMTPEELYEATRGQWVLGRRRAAMELALAVFQGIVREIYRVPEWRPAGTLTHQTRSDVASHHVENRWEFEGEIATDVRDADLGGSVGKGGRIPIRYVNV